MPLKSAPYKYQACEVKTITGKTFQIPAGTHNTVERQTHGGGVTIIVGGSSTVDIGLDGWFRLQKDGFAVP